MDGLLELSGVWMAKAYAVYGLVFLLIPSAVFLYLLLLAAIVWAAAAHARDRQPWPWVPVFVRRPVRLAVEITFGLVNPVLYLAILTPSMAPLRSGPEWWVTLLHGSAWFLLTAVWMLRLFGSALDTRRRGTRAGVRVLLWAAFVCLLLYTAKDAWLMAQLDAARMSAFAFALNVLRICPLYFIPAVLLWDHLRSLARPSEEASAGRDRLFLLPDRTARIAVAGVAGVALVTITLAAHRRSDASVRTLVSEHRDSIRAAAARYDVDPRLIASIVYVTHRDDLSPFRGALERFLISAWARNLRRDFRMRPPDGTGEGADENPLLNRALDISVGLAQVKPRTAQTASVLAMGRTPNELPKPMFFAYRDTEPIGEGWMLLPAARSSLDSPIPVPAEKHLVASALLDAPLNLATCALILALYQNQWEAANADWSIRARPDILATLYQIGFARSKPHAAPRSNAFGTRVREVYEQRWLAELLAPARPAT
jgi:hypothetical protein